MTRIIFVISSSQCNITIGLDPVNEITDPDVKVEAAAFINVLPSSYLINLMVVKNHKKILQLYKETFTKGMVF